MNERYRKSEQLLQQSLKTIPLASQTFSKSIAQYPRKVSPLFIERGQGARVWDVDGNEFIDFVNALLSVSIGYNDSDVKASVLKQIENGVTFSLPHKLEMEVAEMLVEMVPCAEMVRFGKNGTDATSAAIRLARAFTGRDHVLVCGYHGWQDWYIGSTTRDAGVPKAVKALTHVFKYNEIPSLENCFSKFPGQVAAVIMEPMNAIWPEPGFLDKVKSLTQEQGAVLIFDETITGCRFSRGGAQELFGVTPDLATFGKGIANGFPLSAVLGRRDIMMKMEEIFFSGTFAGETLSLAAAKAVLTKIRDGDVIETLCRNGQKLIDGVTTLISKYDAQEIFTITGHPVWTFLIINAVPPYSSLQLKTLFLQEVFKCGILTIGTHNLSYAHTEADIDCLLNTYDKVMPILCNVIAHQNIHEKLETAPLEPIFRVR